MNLMYIFLIIYSIYLINNESFIRHNEIENNIIIFGLLELFLLFIFVKKIKIKTIFIKEKIDFDVWIIILIWHLFWILKSIYRLDYIKKNYKLLVDIRHDMLQNPTYSEYHAYIVLKNYFEILIISFSISLILIVIIRIFLKNKE